jgi:predicted nucleic acid-binding protein
MIVADANLLAYLLMPGEHTEAAEAVLLRDSLWAAPRLWRSELRSVVYQYVRGGQLTMPRALAILEDAELVIGGRDDEVDSAAVLELASRSRCSTYDCEYVALAEALGVPLVTLDRKVLRAFPATAMTPGSFAG